MLFACDRLLAPHAPRAPTENSLRLPRFPTGRGGIENQNAALARFLPRHAEVTTLANKRGKKALPLFLPWALLRALWLSRRHDVLLLGDGVLGVVGYCVKRVHGRCKRVVCILHGLDLTYDRPVYQRLWVRRFIPAADRLIAVGRETIAAGAARGIAKRQFDFIPNGVDTRRFTPASADSARLATLLRTDPDNKQILLTGGRLVRRKGVAWFIEQVLPALPERVIYVVAGDGPDRAHIERAARRSGQAARVRLLGRVSDSDQLLLLRGCDLFIQPNIAVKGDMEGFGLVVLEAGGAGAPVVASRLEGLKDAIDDGENGILVASGDVSAWKATLTRLLADEPARKQLGARARAHVARRHDWDIIARRYVEILARACAF